MLPLFYVAKGDVFEYLKGYLQLYLIQIKINA